MPYPFSSGFTPSFTSDFKDQLKDLIDQPAFSTSAIPDLTDELGGIEGDEASLKLKEIFSNIATVMQTQNASETWLKLKYLLEHIVEADVDLKKSFLKISTNMDELTRRRLFLEFLQSEKLLAIAAQQLQNRRDMKAILDSIASRYTRIQGEAAGHRAAQANVSGGGQVGIAIFDFTMELMEMLAVCFGGREVIPNENPSNAPRPFLMRHA
jgi:hypothetical protein